MIYLDHAATSFPKAPGVADEAARFLREDAGNPGRGSHRLALKAAEALERARLGLARLLGIPDARRLALGPGATWALNVVLKGWARPGSPVLIGPEAHNSILRPLAQVGVDLDEVETDDVLRWDLADLERKLAAAPGALVVVTHGSNVTGAVQDLSEIVTLAHAQGARVVVDAAQTVGAIPINLAELPVDAVAFSGHKGLLGPTGTGGLYLRAGRTVAPLIVGGTGTRSESELPPTELPGALETGTANAFAFSALAVAVDWITARTPAALHAGAVAPAAQLVAGLDALPQVTLHAARAPQDLAVVSFLVAGWDPQELAMALDAVGGVAVRAGFHCAPRAHKRLGTWEGGTLRASLGPFLTAEAVGRFLAAIQQLVG